MLLFLVKYSYSIFPKNGKNILRIFYYIPVFLLNIPLFLKIFLCFSVIIILYIYIYVSYASSKLKRFHFRDLIKLSNQIVF